MNKPCLKSLLVLFLFTLVLNTAHAGSAPLTKIGVMDLAGNAYSEWWYTEENPVLTGVAAANATVTIKIDDQTATATADASGNWTYTPTTLTTGDHTITITTGSDSYAFTLHAGQNVPEDLASGGSATDTTVPATGYSQVFAISAALLLFGASIAWLKLNTVNRVFEKQVLRD